MGGLIRAAFCAAASALEFFNTLTSDSFEAAWLLYRLVEAPLVGAAFIVDIFCLDLRGLQSSALFVIASSTIPILLEQLPGPFLALLRFFVNFDGFKLKQSYDMAPLGPGCTCGSGSSVMEALYEYNLAPLTTRRDIAMLGLVHRKCMSKICVLIYEREA